jgi:AAA15 family ATPase/GTPase
MIKELEILGLYGLYDYRISFSDRKPVKIITGPNGYGKTTILKVINHLIRRDFWYFQILYFKMLRVRFNDGLQILIAKGGSFEFDIRKEDEVKYAELLPIAVVFYDKSNSRHETILSKSYFLRTVRRFAIPRIAYEEISSIDIEERLDQGYSANEDDALPSTLLPLVQYLAGKNAIYVREQRIQYDTIEDRFGRRMISHYNIEKIAEELEQLYNANQSLFANKCQEMDSKFVGKLMRKDNDGYNKEEYEGRLRELQTIVEGYHTFGLAKDFSIDYSYKEEYKKVLSQFIDDVYEKLRVYFGFYLSLYYFNKFISEKSLSNKEMHLDMAEGLKIVDKNKQEVPLRRLSSGEQNIIILYFYLMFKTKPGSLLLVDEPENSIHAAWQESMLADYKEIAKAFGIQVIFSSHSLEFINGDWDNSINLFQTNSHG